MGRIICGLEVFKLKSGAQGLSLLLPVGEKGGMRGLRRYDTESS
jgi:hypothetical protein